MSRSEASGIFDYKIPRSLTWPAILVLASAAPILAFHHPPIMDAPNHLARIWLEAQTPLAGFLGKAYLIEWSRASSNILVDLIGIPLMRVMGLDAFWVLITFLMVLGGPIAAIFISRDLNGRENPWQSLALSAAWGQSTISGFISYSLSVALALAFCLSNLKMAQRIGDKVLCLVKSLQVLAIYLTHPFGLGLFFAFEFAMQLGARTSTIAELTLRKMLAAVLQYVVMAIPTACYIAWNRGNSPLEISPIDYRGFFSHLVSLVSPFFAYDARIELILFAIMALCVILATLQGRLAFHAGLLVSVIILGILSLLIPDGVGNASLLTRRLPLMAALLFCISIRSRTPQAGTPREPLALVCSLMILAHSAWIFFVWQQREGDYVSLLQASKHIPPGSKVLIGLAQSHPATVSPGSRVHGFFIRSHLPALLVPLSHSYVPTLFAIPGQQPLAYTAPFKRLQAQIANIPTDRDLITRTPPFPADRYLESWECDFDYLMIVKPDGHNKYMRPGQARRIMASDFADLFKIDRPSYCALSR